MGALSGNGAGGEWRRGGGGRRRGDEEVQVRFDVVHHRRREANPLHFAGRLRQSADSILEATSSTSVLLKATSTSGTCKRNKSVGSDHTGRTLADFALSQFLWSENTGSNSTIKHMEFDQKGT